MNKDFKYNGFATDWIGFQFERDERFYVVVDEIHELSHRAFEVRCTGSPDTSPLLTADQEDLMNEYIKQLEIENADFADYIDDLHKKLSIWGD